jgi:histidyl-tRNA synthetase
MSKFSTRPPSGTRDFLPVDIARRRYVTSLIEEVYEGHGFVPIETPSIENLSTLLGKYGEEGDQLLYRLLHRRDALKRAVEGAREQGRAALEGELADQGLRYDLTVPLARVVAQYGDLPRFFKRYQIQPVWRADRPGKGRFREFYQCDVDITGTTSLVAEAEVCSAVASVLERLGFKEFTIKLNHRELLRAIIATAGIDPDLEGTALVAVDKLDKIGRDGVATELADRGISSESATVLLDLIAPTEGSSDNATELARLRAAVTDPRGAPALDDLERLCSLAAGTPAGARLRIDPALARGLSYYTGPIFEISVEQLRGSLGGGGRYDDLVGMFGKRKVPAVGFSLGLERILVVMEEQEMYPPLRVGPQMLLCWMGVEEGEVMATASRLRAQGVAVEVFPEPAKLKKQLQYAAAAGVAVPFAGILGESELAAGEITIKQLATGEQRRVPIDDVAAALADATDR